MRAIILLILILGMGGSAFAQQLTRYVVASGGGELSTSSGPSLSWTLGEISTENISNGLSLQQGFQQGGLEIAVSIHPSIIPSSAWKVFPNPTDYYLQVETNFTAPWHYELRDVLGRTVLWGEVDQPELRLDLPLLTAGIYWLTVYEKDGSRGSKKLLINQN